MPTKSAASLDELTQAMLAFVESKGWLDKDSPKKQSQRSLAISLALEAAEVLEHFQWGETTQQPDALAEELADVMLYLLQLAHVSGVDLGEAVMKKLEINAARDWSAPGADDPPSSL